MTLGKTEDDRLFDEAVGHVIRMQADPNDPVANETLRLWCARSAAHARIWAELAEIHGLTGQVLAPPPKGISRRGVVRAGLGGIAAATLGYAILPATITAVRADHRTSVGQIHRIVLPDQSTITLGPESAISLDFTADQRGIRLIAGMAYCELVRDTSRPFRLRAETVEVVTEGCTVNAMIDADVITLEVSGGQATVQTKSVRPVHMGDGKRIDIAPQGRVIGHLRAATPDGSAWRDGLIVAESETVAALIARIARWMPGRVVIASDWLGQQQVSGVFDLADPSAALAAVVHPHGGHVRQITPFMTVISAI